MLGLQVLPPPLPRMLSCLGACPLRWAGPAGLCTGLAGDTDVTGLCREQCCALTTDMHVFRRAVPGFSLRAGDGALPRPVPAPFSGTCRIPLPLRKDAVADGPHLLLVHGEGSGAGRQDPWVLPPALGEE